MPDITRVAIITDPMMVKLGYVDRVIHYLHQRQTPVAIEVFSEVEPDPSTVTVERGTEMMRRFQPDCIIALGGGSPMDAAKGMWMFYEYPDTDFNNLKQKFMDIRKRIYKYPRLGQKAQFVAIPTTSGTGSEVTSFAVITDKNQGNTKYPLADYELTPDVAIIDPEFVYSLPKTAVADTGMDVLTHAIEAYVSVMASDYTDGLAIKAIQLVFQYLEQSALSGDKLAREKCIMLPRWQEWRLPMHSWVLTTVLRTNGVDNTTQHMVAQMPFCYHTSFVIMRKNRRSLLRSLNIRTLLRMSAMQKLHAYWDCLPVPRKKGLIA